jgi:RNA polymerase sigma-70 factor (ECF subfamily)
MEQCIPSPDDTECQIDALLLSETINAFLSTLSEDKRNVFIRRYWFMDSVADIAKFYGMSQSKIKSILFRSRNQLREYLEQKGIEI